MIYRSLGSTGIEVSAIALGTVKIGRNQSVKYPQPFDLPSDDEVLDLLDAARDAGINLIDSAPAYGTSEVRLGELLPSIDGGRKFRICTKVGESFHDGTSSFDFSPEAIRASVGRSSDRLQRDRVDIVLLHSDGNDLAVLESGAVEALQRCQSDGMILAWGLSGKTVEGGIAALDAGADVVMVTHNPAYQGESAVIEHARLLGRGVLIKKALNSGHFSTDEGGVPDPAEAAKPARQAIRFSLDTPGVSSLVIGTLSPERLRQNAESASS